MSGGGGSTIGIMEGVGHELARPGSLEHRVPLRVQVVCSGFGMPTAPRALSSGTFRESIVFRELFPAGGTCGRPSSGRTNAQTESTTVKCIEKCMLCTGKYVRADLFSIYRASSKNSNLQTDTRASRSDIPLAGREHLSRDCRARSRGGDGKGVPLRTSCSRSSSGTLYGSRRCPRSTPSSCNSLGGARERDAA